MIRWTGNRTRHARRRRVKSSPNLLPGCYVKNTDVANSETSIRQCFKTRLKVKLGWDFGLKVNKIRNHIVESVITLRWKLLTLHYFFCSSNALKINKSHIRPQKYKILRTLNLLCTIYTEFIIGSKHKELHRTGLGHASLRLVIVQLALQIVRVFAGLHPRSKKFKIVIVIGSITSLWTLMSSFRTGWLVRRRPVIISQKAGKQHTSMLLSEGALPCTRIIT